MQILLAAGAQGGADFSIIGLIKHADPIVQGIMLMLVLASVACWAIIIEKIVKLRGLNRQAALIEEAAREKHLPSTKEEGAAGAIARAAELELTGGTAPGETREDVRGRLELAMRSAMKSELKRLEVGLPFLATVGSASPFIGLLGTVWGIMNSFTSIAQAKDTSLAVVAPGIAEALFATAIGLAAAIPAVIAYNQFSVSMGRAADRIGGAVGALARNLTRAAAVRLAAE